MSWLFGVGKPPPPQEAPQFPTLPEGLFPGGTGGGDGGKKDDGDGSGEKSGVAGSWSNFDPTGLERAAKAAKDLDKSRKFRSFFRSPFHQ